MIARVILGFILLFETLALAESQVPPINPSITGTFPHGGQRGQEIEVTLQGRNLQNTQSIHFKSAKLQATVISSDAYTVKARIRVASNAEPGRHDLRLTASHGTALGYFDVSDFVETRESEPNNDSKKAQELRFPALINGIVTQGDYDFYRFEARAGQTLTFDVLATRNGSQTDSVISILDEHGEELDYSDDYYGFKDPHLVYSFQKDGAYFLRLSGSSEAGCDTCDYRLFAGESPFAELAMPAGGRQGSTVEFTLHGVNLDKVKEVTLGDGLATGTVLSTEPTRARVRITVPKSAELGAYRLHVNGAMRPVPFVVSKYQEVTVAGGRARSRKDPVPVTLPVVANGIIDEPQAGDYFVFRVDDTKPVVLEAHAMQLDYLTDPLVVIYDQSRKRLA